MSSLIDLARVLALCALGAAAVWGMLRFITAAHDSRKVGAIGFAVAFATFAAVGATIRLQDNDEPPPALTVGDVVRPNLQGTLPTRTGIEEWKSAFDGFELQWPADDAPLETERPNDVITFDDDFDGYIAGEVEQDGVRAVAFIGFEDDEISWFTCHVSGYGTPWADDFLRTCWDTAAVTDADLDSGAEWLDSALDQDSDTQNPLLLQFEQFCPAVLLVSAAGHNPAYINLQVTVAASQGCS